MNDNGSGSKRLTPSGRVARSVCRFREGKAIRVLLRDSRRFSGTIETVTDSWFGLRWDSVVWGKGGWTKIEFDDIAEISEKK